MTRQRVLVQFGVTTVVCSSTEVSDTNGLWVSSPPVLPSLSRAGSLHHSWRSSSERTTRLTTTQ